MSEASIALAAVNRALELTVETEPVGTKGLVAPKNPDAWSMAGALHAAQLVLEKVVIAEENDPVPISEGERYEIVDLLDGIVVCTFTSWSHPDPGLRAFEMFESYPRDATLRKTKVVKYEGREIMRNFLTDAEKDVVNATSPEN